MISVILSSSHLSVLLIHLILLISSSRITNNKNIPSVFHFSYCAVELCCLYFLALCYTFLVPAWSVPPFFFFPEFIFIIITANTFSGRSSVSTSLICLLGFLSWSFVWNIALCCLILSNFLCLQSPLRRLLGWSSSSFWYLAPGGWGWSRGLCRLPGGRDWCLPTGG